MEKKHTGVLYESAIRAIAMRREKERKRVLEIKREGGPETKNVNLPSRRYPQEVRVPLSICRGPRLLWVAMASDVTREFPFSSAHSVGIHDGAGEPEAFGGHCGLATEIV